MADPKLVSALDRNDKVWVLDRFDGMERDRADLQRQLSEAQTLELEHQATIRHLKAERDDYLNKAFLADLDRQAAVERAEKAEGWAKDWHGIVETICTVLELGTPDADQVVAAVRAKFEQAERAWEREAKLATHMANDRNDAEAEVARLREALTTVRGHFHVEHGAGRIPSIGYDSQALLKVIHTLDAALQGEPKP